jgi:hypothetical protein
MKAADLMRMRRRIGGAAGIGNPGFEESLARRSAKRFLLRGPIRVPDMVKLKIATLVRIAPALALFSCAAPKAVVVGPPPAPKQEKAEEPAVAELPPANPDDDGIRLPEMLGLPADGEFRATTTIAPKAGGEGNAVISRPPTDPPPRPKPKVPGAE